jgi:hypothetical protein
MSGIILIGTNSKIWMRMGLIGCEVSYKSGQLVPLETMVIVYIRGKTLTETIPHG